MAVNGAEVWNIKALEHLTGRQNHSDAFLNSLKCIFDASADNRHVFQDISCRLSQTLVGLAQPDPGEVFRHRTYRRVDRHRVIVEYDQQLPLDQSEIIERLKGCAVNDTGIADYRHDFIGAVCCVLRRLFFAFSSQLFAESHSDCRCDRSARMPHGKRIVITFGGIGKTADPVRAAKTPEFIFSSCNNFMCIALMPDIPEQLILLKIEHAVQRQRQFHYTQIACQMPAGLTDRFENKLAYFLRQGLQLRY